MLIKSGKREVTAKMARIERHRSPYSKRQMLTVDVFGSKIGENGTICIHGDAGNVIRNLEKILARCKEMVNRER